MCHARIPVCGCCGFSSGWHASELQLCSCPSTFWQELSTSGCREVGLGMNKLSGYVADVANLTQVAGDDAAKAINSTVFNGCACCLCSWCHDMSMSPELSELRQHFDINTLPSCSFHCRAAGK